MKSSLIQIITPVILLFLIACGGPEGSESVQSQPSNNSEPSFSEFELEHGIGPVKELIELSPLSNELAARGRQVYEMKCETCHSLDIRMVGPALRDVLDRRSPEFVMNMILNPNEMAQKHPDGREMLQEFMTVMPYQNVNYDDALAILEYLRLVLNE